MRDCDLRLGRWQDVFSEDDRFDATIFDAPYDEGVHAGHDAVADICDPLDYTFLTEADVAEIVDFFSPRTRGWFVTITSDNLIHVWKRELRKAGRYPFAAIPIVDRGSRVRLQGDGHSSISVFLVAARPRTAEAAKCGTLPGDYLYGEYGVPTVYERAKGDPRSKRRGGKPLGIMRAVVRDHSNLGDLVCDPFAGYGTTLLAALIEGRRAIGAERDEAAHRSAQERLQRGYTPDIFAALGR